MFDPGSMIAGAGLLLLGFGPGVVVGVRRGRAPRPPEPVRATCECKHSLAMHEPGSGRCRFDGYESAYSTARGAYQLAVKCSCRQYVGPKPVETLFQPQILPPGAG